jgi:serine O-acetyltransferase
MTLSSHHGVPAQADADDIWNVGGIVERLGEIRRTWRAQQPGHAEYGVDGFPSRHRVAKLTEDLCGVLYPLRLGPDHVRLHNEDAFITQALQISLSRLQAQLRLELLYALPGADARDLDRRATAIVAAFARALPEVRLLVDTDIAAAYRGDPAARSLDEVLICYPGLLAIIHHRLAHLLHGLGATLVARIMSEIAHGLTGIDIHPGARIAEGFFIDHGTGVVIGETAIIGRNVRLYQGVTLGAKSFPAHSDGALVKAVERHPIIGDNVVIYAGATILGRVTIGANSQIGGNVWLTHDVAPCSRVLQAHEQALVTRRDACPDGAFDLEQDVMRAGLAQGATITP